MFLQGYFTWLLHGFVTGDPCQARQGGSAAKPGKAGPRPSRAAATPWGSGRYRLRQDVTGRDAAGNKNLFFTGGMIRDFPRLTSGTLVFSGISSFAFPQKSVLRFARRSNFPHQCTWEKDRRVIPTECR